MRVVMVMVMMVMTVALVHTHVARLVPTAHLCVVQLANRAFHIVVVHKLNNTVVMANVAVTDGTHRRHEVLQILTIMPKFKFKPANCSRTANASPPRDNRFFVEARVESILKSRASFCRANTPRELYFP